MSKNAKQYAKRLKWIKRLGHSAYSEYLESPLWQSIRKRILKRDRYECYACGRRAWQVHHLRYTRGNLHGENGNYLTSLCGDCHGRVTWGPLGEWRSLTAGYDLLRAWREEAGLPPKPLPTGRRRRRKGREKKAPTKKRLRVLAMCPSCGVNRRYRGGECPPCRKSAG